MPISQNGKKAYSSLREKNGRITSQSFEKDSAKMFKEQHVMGSRLRGALVVGTPNSVLLSSNLFKEQRAGASSVQGGLVVGPLNLVLL